MRQDSAIDAARKYFEQWGVPWGIELSAAKERRFLVTRSFAFTVHTGTGIAVVEVSWPGYRVRRLEFYPVDGRSWMVPLWAAFPNYSSVTAGWRQGSGEEYKYRWHDWYRRLSAAERADYQQRFPPPEHDWGGWSRFYEEIADEPSDGSIADFISGRVP